MSLSVCGPSSIGAAIVCNQDQLPPLAPQCIAETFLRKAFSLDGCGSRGARTLSGRVTRGGAPLSTSVRLLRIGLRVDMVVSYKGKSLEPKSMAPRLNRSWVPRVWRRNPGLEERILKQKNSSFFTTVQKRGRLFSLCLLHKSKTWFWKTYV